MIRTKQAKNKKTSLIQIKVTPIQKNTVEQYAISHGYTLTNLIELSLNEFMKRHK